MEIYFFYHGLKIIKVTGAIDSKSKKFVSDENVNLQPSADIIIFFKQEKLSYYLLKSSHAFKKSCSFFLIHCC
jgi:hypothetical protein